MSVQKQVETANKGSLREGAPVENGWGSLRNKILCALIWRDITVRAASSFRHPSGATNGAKHLVRSQSDRYPYSEGG